MLFRGRSRKYLILVSLLLALSLVAAACGGDGGAPPQQQDEGEPVEGGTLVFGAEQEPLCLNSTLAACNMFWAAMVDNMLLPHAYLVQPDLTFAPSVLDGEAEINEDPFTVTYRIKEEAQWSDGTPISAEDFEFTWQLTVDPKNEMADRTGMEDIESAEIVDEKTITFTFKKPYAGYKLLFSNTPTGIYPKHALEGENFNKVWRNNYNNPKTGEPISGGPFMFDNWNKGQDITMVKNEEYWGQVAHLDEVVYRFITDTNAEIEALRGGEVDVIYPQPQLELADLLNAQGIEVQSSLGTVWEHLDFQFNNPLLAQDFVRQAIAHGIDRQAVVDQLVGKIKPDTEVLHNLMFVANQPGYEPHFDQWNFDPDKSRQLLEDNGCTMAGRFYECDGETLEFSFTTTAGNALRELTFEIIQAQLADVGINVTSAIKDAGVVFNEVLPNPNRWELFMFAWVGNPDPSSGVTIWVCDGESNFNGYCNEQVDELLAEAGSLVNPDEAFPLFNEADALMADDLPVLPLYQKPTFLAFQDYVHGMEDNPTSLGPVWNSQEWWVERGAAE